MDLSFVDYDLFEAAAEGRVRVAEERFVVKSDMLGKIGITPGLSIHRDLTVLGNDWLPVRPNGVACVQQMTHTPQTFLGKTRIVQASNGKWVASPARERTLQDTAVLVGSSTNYYHWWIDNVPRLLMARKYGQLEGRKVLVEANLTRFAADTLAMLGVGDDRIERIAPDEAVHVSEVCVPAMLASATVVHPAVPALIRDAFPLPRGGARRRIYLCRQDAPTRQLVNEDALAKLLAHWGFERLFPSRMTVREQIEAASNAEAIVAVHGAALANMLFAPPDAKVFEIFTPAYPASFFLLLAHACGVRHWFSPASVVDARDDLSPLHQQWNADLDALEILFEEELA